MKILIALGGNSLIRYGQKGTYKEQIENMRLTCMHLANLIKNGNKLIITHGNGPQVGNILLQEESTKDVPQMPLDVCNAMTEGQIGYFIQNSLIGELRKISVEKKVVTVLTQTLVDKNDPAFKNPRKPIGPFFKEKKFEKMVYIHGKGYRKVVPSPKPVEIIESDVIKNLVDNDFITIACGGGGIPVVRNRNKLIGVEAVIDKDRCAAKLAKKIDADILLILTDVDGVAINFGKPNEKKLDRMSVAEAKKYLEEGEFGEGRMMPKIEASIDFLKSGGKKCFIGLPEKTYETLKCEAGTTIFL